MLRDNVQVCATADQFSELETISCANVPKSKVEPQISSQWADDEGFEAHFSTAERFVTMVFMLLACIAYIGHGTVSHELTSECLVAHLSTAKCARRISVKSFQPHRFSVLQS
jgi:hypothetical protein